MLVPTARAPSRPSNSAVAASADYARRLAFACDVQCVAAVKQIASNRQRGDESKASRCSHDSRRPWRRPDRRFATALIRDLTGLQPMAEIAKMCTGSGTAVLRIFLPRGAPRCTYCSALRARQNRTRRTACALSSRCAAICRCWARLPTTRTESAAQLSKCCTFCARAGSKQEANKTVSNYWQSRLCTSCGASSSSLAARVTNASVTPIARRSCAKRFFTSRRATA